MLQRHEAVRQQVGRRRRHLFHVHEQLQAARVSAASVLQGLVATEDAQRPAAEPGAATRFCAAGARALGDAVARVSPRALNAAR